MRIGMDITPMVHHPNSGIGRYVTELSRALLQHEPEHDYTWWYAGPPVARAAGDRGPRVSRLASSRRRMRARWLLSHVAHLRQDDALRGVDVFHATDTCGPYMERRPLVSTVHDLFFLTHPSTVSPLNRHYLARTIRGSLACSRRVVTLSGWVACQLSRHYGVPEEKLRVIPGGVAQGFFERRSPEAVQGTLRAYRLPERFVLTVAAAEPRKNLDTLVTAFRGLLEAEAVPHSLVIAGPSGRSRGGLLRLVRSLGLEQRVLWREGIPEGDLPALYQAAEAFALPSLEEGFGFPVLEAMASGTPVVCSAAGALPEVAGDAGLLLAPLDEAGWARGLAAVLRDQGLRSQMVEKGRHRAARCTWRRAARETLRTYQETAAASAGRSPGEARG